MTTQEKRRALGRGLDALLPTAPVSAPPRLGAESSMFECPIERLVPQKDQPRRAFDDQSLEELAQSIREHGLLEPILVRRAAPPVGAAGPANDAYEIIAGERRWRASQKAGLRDVLVIVKDVTAADAFELALIENVQREDLNPLELAEALDRLMREHGYTQEHLATRLGKDRATIANSVRLLKLPPRVRQMVLDGALTEGHARALLGAQDPKLIEQLAEKVARAGMSVRETERLVRSLAKDKKDSDAKEPEEPQKNANLRDLEQRLARRLSARVEVRDAKGKGEIAVRYSSLDELDRLLDMLLK